MRLFSTSGLYTPRGQDEELTDVEEPPGSLRCNSLGVAPIRHPDTSRPMHCTNQSIRRSAAQWAGRCDAQMRDAKNTGRWRSVDMLLKYMGHGQFQRASMESGGGRDPIFVFWVYQPSTVGDASGQSLL